MAEYLSPGVYVEEFDSGPVPMAGVGTSTAGFIGVAEKGPTVGIPTLIGSYADFTRAYGGYLSEKEFGEHRFLAYAVNHFFANGGGKCYVMRVAPADAVTAKSKCAEGQEGVCDITAKNQGEWGNLVSVRFTPSSKSKTQVLEDLGEGKYKVKSTADFLPGDVVCTTAETPEYNVIKGTEGNTITFIKPFEEEVVDAGILPKVLIKTCEVNLDITYDTIKETFEFCSFNAIAPTYLQNKLSKSALIDITAKASEEPISPYDIVKATFGVEGEEVKITLKEGLNGTKGAITDDTFIGEDKGPGQRTGIQAFLEITDVSIMSVPGNVSPNVLLSLVSHCQNLTSRFAVLDIPKDLKTVPEIVAYRDMFDSDYCAMYHPWLRTYDPLDKKDFFIPPSGSMIGIYARVDKSRGVHKAPANEVVNNCTGLGSYFNSTEQDILNPKGVNLIRKFPGAGIRVWGARTASSRPLWKYINVRRLFIFLEESIRANTNWVVFEPNDELLWSRVQRTIEMFLEGVWRSGALVGGGNGSSFYVDIGPNTMTKADIDNGMLICVIGVAPVKPAEFVIFRITQKTGD